MNEKWRTLHPWECLKKTEPHLTAVPKPPVTLEKVLNWHFILSVLVFTALIGTTFRELAHQTTFVPLSWFALVFDGVGLSVAIYFRFIVSRHNFKKIQGGKK